MPVRLETNHHATATEGRESANGPVIRGAVVVEETGEPLAGLVVALYDVNRLPREPVGDIDHMAEQMRAEGTLLGSARTDRAGNFAVPVGEGSSTLALLVTAGHVARDRHEVAREQTLAVLRELSNAVAFAQDLAIRVGSALLSDVGASIRPHRPAIAAVEPLDPTGLPPAQITEKLKRRVRGTAIPTSQARLDQDDYALTGRRLAIHDDARRGSAPGKSAREVNRKLMASSLEELSAATLHKVDGTTAPVDADRDRDGAVARAMNVNISEHLLQAMPGAVGGHDDDRTISFSDLRHVLPQLGLRTPQSLGTRIALMLDAAIPSGDDDDDGGGGGDDDDTIDTSLPPITDVPGFLRQRLHDRLVRDQATPHGSTGESTDEQVIPQPKGASDAIAVHDFHDLKLALPDVWAEAIGGHIPFLDGVPPFVRDLVPIDLEQWQRVVAGLPRIGLEYRDLERAIAEAQLYDLMLRGIRPPAQLIATTGDPSLASWIDGAFAAMHTGWEPDTTHVVERRDALRSEWTGNINALLASTPAPDGTTPMAVDAGYRFGIFAPGSVNFGLMVTYRQEWAPVTYQVGELVKTLPLAPKETRKYTTRTKLVQKRARKEVERAVATRSGEDTTGSKAVSEAVQRAKEKTSFGMTASGSVEIMEIANVGGTNSLSHEAGSDSAETKRKLREAVSKSAREITDERRIEISTEVTDESEMTTLNEISNPNEEITVTYLFYELQRRYRVVERLHEVRPVVLVAQDVPPPEVIDEDWVVRHDWILRRSLLDDSFQPALEYALVGRDATREKVTALGDKMDDVRGLVTAARTRLGDAENSTQLGENEARMYGEMVAALTSQSDGVVGDVFEWGLGGAESAHISGMEGRLERASERLERADARTRAMSDDLAMQRNALDRAVDAYNEAVAEQRRNERHVERLVQHVRDNLLHYLHAIWSHEPPDQRFGRLFDARVPVTGYPGDDDEVRVRVRSDDGSLDSITPGTPVELILPPPSEVEERRLIDIADLDDLIGFKGNYMIFPLRRPTYLTSYMLQSYVGGSIDDSTSARSAAPRSMAIGDVAGTASLIAHDPDPAAITSADLVSVHDALEARDRLTDGIVTTLEALLRRRLLEPEGEPTEVVVPTDSLHIEALPGAHPILEGFKLEHRALDAERVNLENARLEMRLWSLDLDDPDVDRVIRIDKTEIAETV